MFLRVLSDLLLPHYTLTRESHPFSWVQLFSTRWPLPNEYLELWFLFWGPRPFFPTTHLTSSTWTLAASLVAQLVKSLPAMQETWVWSLDWKDPLEKGTATHSSTLAWRIPWTEDPSRLQSTGCKELDTTPQHPQSHGGLVPTPGVGKQTWVQWNLYPEKLGVWTGRKQHLSNR